MNRGIMYKAYCEVRFITLLIGAALLAIETIFAFVLPILEKQFENIFAQLPFVQTIMKALLGTDLGPGFGKEGIQALAWVHPAVLALIWAHGIIVCTRVPAGEVDRGTADVLFGLPVSRWSVYRSECVVWLMSMIVILLMAATGHRVGVPFAESATPVPLARLSLVLLNLFCLGAAVGSIAWLISALSDRRGKAIGVVFAIVLASFLLNFLGQFWAPAEKVMFLGVLNYYRPMEIIRSGVFPGKDTLVLISVAAAVWTLGGIVFARRDITTT